MAERLRDATASEARLRADAARLPPPVRAEIERGWAMVLEGRLDDALRHLRRAEGIARAASGIVSDDYARLVSLVATVLELQQDPGAASQLLLAALDERDRAFRDSQRQLADQAFRTQLRAARETGSPEAAGQALRILDDYRLPDGTPGRALAPVPGARRSLFDRDFRRCEIADLYFIRAAGRNLADLRAGMARLSPEDLATTGNGGENWECRSVAARLEVMLGIAGADNRLVLRGMDRLETILRYWGAAGVCPHFFKDYGPSIYRLGLAVGAYGSRAGDSEMAGRATQYQENLRYAHRSLLPLPPPVDLHPYLARIGIALGTG